MLDLMLMDTDHTDTHTDTAAITERDPLMLNQRLMLMPSMVSMDMDIEPTIHMSMELTDHMLTPPDGEDMERDLLMLRPRLTQLSSTPVSTLQSTLFTAPPLSTTLTQSRCP